MGIEQTALSQLATIASTHSLARLEGFARSVWEDWAEGRLTDAQAQSLAESIEARRAAVRGLDIVAARTPDVAAAAKARGQASYFPAKRKAAISPDRRVSIERRRTLAASGPMPPQLACRFTVGELAALRIVADDVRDKGACRLCLAEIAARAGVGITTARNALRTAARDGLLTIEERRRDKRPNLSNVVRIISREWTIWIARGGRFKAALKTRTGTQGGGSKKTESTDKGSYRTSKGDRSLSGQRSSFPNRRPLNAAALG